jgi:MFS superfamily sulfate permease-like transporter
MIRKKTMTDTDRIKYLRVALVLIGLTFTFGLWPLTIVWPSGWSWHGEGRSYYLEMILALYATLGIFLMLAARNPLIHRSLIWFTVWSSVAHGAVMAVQSFQGHHTMGHLWGDVLALFAVAAVLALLTPREA